MVTDGKILVKTAEAANRLSMGVTEFRRLHNTGRLGPEPVMLFDKKLLWSVRELTEWELAGCPVREKWLARQSKS